MPLYIAKSGDLEGCHACLTDRLTTLKDRATQLLIKYKSGALVTQYYCPPDQIGLERIIIHPRLILHVTKILFDSSQLWLQVHPMCANYRFWY